MSSITFGGLATGLDTGAIVEALMAVRRQPMDRLQARRSLAEQQKSALSTLQQKLLAIKKAAADLDTPLEFASFTATSSQDNVLTATATTSATPGVHQIHVNNLATAERQRSESGYAGLDSVVGTGFLAITVGQESTVVSLPGGGGTLTDLRDAINEAGAGVYASIINDGSGSDAYYLVLTAADTGTAGDFTLDWSGFSGSPPRMQSVTAAADASLEIDGIAVTSSSNSLSDAITGLTLNLHDVSSSDVELTVASDVEAIQGKVQSFIDAYNDLVDFVQSQSVDGSPLQGNPTLRSVSSDLSSLLAQPQTIAGSDLTVLGQIGIAVQRGGKLEFSADDFAAALAADYNGVRDLFVERDGNLGKAYQLREAINRLTDPNAGIFKISNDALVDKIKNLDQSIERYQSSLDSYQAYLEKKFTAMESMVASLQAQGNFLTATFG